MLATIERIGLALFIITFLWQVAIPLALSRPTFPMFRRSAKLAKAKEDLARAEEDYVVFDVEREALGLRSRIKKEELDGQEQRRVGGMGDGAASQEATDPKSSDAADAQPATKKETGESNV